MREGWTSTTWGDVSDLRYGKSLSNYRNSSGSVEVFGTNGPIGWTKESLSEGPRPIVGRKGAYRGVHLARDRFWVIDTAYWLEPQPGLDPLWAYYALLGVDINGMDSGSAIPSLTRDHFRALPLILPPLTEQHRIAEVLGALDDLIETNRRLIESLVASADAIALLGDEGGETLTLGDVAKVSGGGTPSTKDPLFWDGDINWATPTDMTALPSPYLFSTSRTITKAGLSACSSGLFPVGTILMTSRATIGTFAIAQIPVAVNQGFIVVEPKEDIDRFYLFHEMRRRVPEFIQRANGSTFLEISRGTFKSLPVVWPSAETRRLLSATLTPIHTTTAEVQREIAKIRHTRDELLPLLLSGAVTVSETAA